MTDDLDKAVIASALPESSREVALKGVVECQGEFAGWHVFTDEPFNQMVGPFYHKDLGGSPMCGFRPTARNLNSFGVVHGGALLTFADFSMFVAAKSHYMTTSIVTVTIATEFVGTAKAGDYVEARAEIIRAGGSLITIRGLMMAEGQPILNYSGTFKRMSKKPPEKR
jgi:uncharacterized protein (TIGR00369 family)